MPILAFVQGPERCDCLGFDPAVGPREDESADNHGELLEMCIHDFVYFLTRKAGYSIDQTQRSELPLSPDYAMFCVWIIGEMR